MKTKTTKPAPAFTVGRTYNRNGITLRVLEQIRPGLFLVIDHAGGHRLHTGAKDKGYRGYITTWRTPRRGSCFRVNVFRTTGKDIRRIVKTAAGAVRSLKYHARKMCA